MSDILVEEPKTEISRGGTDDPNELAHIVRKSILNEGYIGQRKIKALCGFEWIPHRDPGGLPICKKCKAILNQRFNRESN